MLGSRKISRMVWFFLQSSDCKPASRHASFIDLNRTKSAAGSNPAFTLLGKFMHCIMYRAIEPFATLELRAIPHAIRRMEL